MALILILSLIAAMEKPLPTMQQDIVYEVFVYSYCDSNGDGIGDLPGLISKLDHIRGLGATAVWITPVHPAPSYHKYDVMDYYAIDPVFGTMDDMDKLIVGPSAKGKIDVDAPVDDNLDRVASALGNAVSYQFPAGASIAAGG